MFVISPRIYLGTIEYLHVSNNMLRYRDHLSAMDGLKSLYIFSTSAMRYKSKWIPQVMRQAEPGLRIRRSSKVL